MSNQQGVLLDLDGTLLDTAPDLAGAANALRRERGWPDMLLSQLRNKCSYGTRGMLATGLDLHPGDEGYEAAKTAFVAAYRARLTAETAPFEGMRQALKTLVDRGMAWGVVTNKVEQLALPLMAAMQFDPAPACVIGGDSAHTTKPDPAPVLLGCERAGLVPEQSVYVGDSARDIAAGRAAGMATIGVSYGYFEADEAIADWGADRIIDHADALPDAVMQLLAQGSRAVSNA